jgi:hypothetical protein
MASTSLMMWAAARANRIKRLRAAHEAFGGTGPGRRWVTDELNHALILRLASEFQGFARDLHDETGAFVARCLAPGNQQLQDSLRIPYTLYRKMNQGINMARNGIVHDDGAKIARVQADGWPLTLRSVDRWKSSLDGLARGMDRVVSGHLKLMYGTTPWQEAT